MLLAAEPRFVDPLIGAVVAHGEQRMVHFPAQGAFQLEHEPDVLSVDLKGRFDGDVMRRRDDSGGTEKLLDSSDQFVAD